MVIYEELKGKLILLLSNTPVPLSKAQISQSLNVPYYWVEKMLEEEDIKKQVKEIPISPARVGYAI